MRKRTWKKKEVSKPETVILEDLDFWKQRAVLLEKRLMELDTEMKMTKQLPCTTCDFLWKQLEHHMVLRGQRYAAMSAFKAVETKNPDTESGRHG
jgi:hypothetical protein